jgi:twitching motility two-component system response regulator PilH
MGKKILVVDDDPRIRLFVVTVLEQHQYLPLEASNGQEGMALIRQERPDLVILDILLPKRSGVRMYRELKTDASFKNIPVVILSGMREKAFTEAQEVLDEFDGSKIPKPEAYLEKPVEPDELAEVIKTVL